MSKKSYEWGWTSYKFSGWKKDDGCKFYRGRFMSIEEPGGYSVCYVYFWAHRPILALRKIVESGKDPLTFAEKTIN